MASESGEGRPPKVDGSHAAGGLVRHLESTTVSNATSAYLGALARIVLLAILAVAPAPASAQALSAAAAAIEIQLHGHPKRAVAHQTPLSEIDERYDDEKRVREIDLLTRQKALNEAEIDNREFRERVWWLLATAFAVSLLVIAIFYRKLRDANRLLAQKHEELRLRSSRDPLTALYNRGYFQDFMSDETDRADRRRPSSGHASTHALLLIDIDFFKQTNDRTWTPPGLPCAHFVMT